MPNHAAAADGDRNQPSERLHPDLEAGIFFDIEAEDARRMVAEMGTLIAETWLTTGIRGNNAGVYAETLEDDQVERARHMV